MRKPRVILQLCTQVSFPSRSGIFSPRPSPSGITDKRAEVVGRMRMRGLEISIMKLPHCMKDIHDITFLS